MKTLYIDCGMGAAGDMMTAALLDLLSAEEAEAFVDRLNRLGLPGVVYRLEQAEKCGIMGKHMTVTAAGTEEGEIHSHGGHCHEDHEHAGSDHCHEDHDHAGSDHWHEDHDHAGSDHCHEEHDHAGHAHSHVHHGISDIRHIVEEHLDIPERVRQRILQVYEAIAEAESHVHGVPMEQIHFHEVGSLDAIADVTAVCLLLDEIGADEILASPVHVGSGTVRCAHGVLPVPAPATAWLLRDIPMYGGKIAGELCTPTGAALLRTFADRFGDMPVMTVSSIGYGMGKKDFERANCVRVLLGETAGKTDEILELSCNMDDMTGERLGFAMEQIFAAGALDVYTIPVNMKKNRPGILLRAMCRPQDKEAVIEAIFKHTSTIGIREQRMNRYVLDRSMETVQTRYGAVRQKVSSGYGVRKVKPEYEDLAGIAREQGIGIRDVEAELQAKL